MEIKTDKYGRVEQLVEELHYYDLKAGLVKLLWNDLFKKHFYSGKINKDEVIEKVQSSLDQYLNFKCSIQWNHDLNFSVEIESEPINSVVDFEMLDLY